MRWLAADAMEYGSLHYEQWLETCEGLRAAAARLINARTTDDQKKIAALIKHKRNDLGESLQRLQKLERRAHVPVVQGIEGAAKEPDRSHHEFLFENISRQRQERSRAEFCRQERHLIPGIPA